MGHFFAKKYGTRSVLRAELKTSGSRFARFCRAFFPSRAVHGSAIGGFAVRAGRGNTAMRRKLLGLLLTAFVSISASATALAQAPIVTSVSPNKGLGGTSVTVTGCNFSGVTAVDFGGSSATFGAPSGTGTENSWSLHRDGDNRGDGAARFDFRRYR